MEQAPARELEMPPIFEPWEGADLVGPRSLFINALMAVDFGITLGLLVEFERFGPTTSYWKISPDYPRRRIWEIDYKEICVKNFRY